MMPVCLALLRWVMGEMVVPFAKEKNPGSGLRGEIKTWPC